jgi:hypothetical protein
MTAYLARRTASAVVVLFEVSIFIFMLHVIYRTSAVDVLSPHANRFSIAQ